MTKSPGQRIEFGRATFLCALVALGLTACGSSSEPGSGAGTGGGSGTAGMGGATGSGGGSGGTGGSSGGATGSWAVVSAPQFLFNITGLWGSAASDVWAVDDYGDVGHYDGNSWSIVAQTANPLYAVNGTSATNVFIAGASGTVLQLVGSSLVPLPQYGNDFSGLWVFSPTDVCTADTYLEYVWNGTTWTSATGNPGDIIAIWGAPNGDLWGAGRYGSITFWPAGGVLQTQVVGSSTGPDAWQSIWGIDDNTVWVVGTSIKQWTGTAWMTVQANNGIDAFMAVWATSPTNVWVVGQGGIIYHGDGYAFSPVSSPTIEDLDAIWGSGPNDIWAAGAAGTILHYAP